MTSRGANQSLRKENTNESAKKKTSRPNDTKTTSSRGDSIIDEMEATIANRWGLGVSKTLSDDGLEERKDVGYKLSGYELMEQRKCHPNLHFKRWSSNWPNHT